ncbi:hypothetical protein QJS04_geneDACA022522 [Acorus gramineus]|uniref:Uncharacterized protein n=1 Tax=Acorus gramineus TaxID=55184 RepID=A0AAV9A7G8_ACOGR|nr:hypothetical protein QJS04_geneDACA022522 [Acorus gramineus]
MERRLGAGWKFQQRNLPESIPLRAGGDNALRSISWLPEHLLCFSPYRMDAR